MKGRPYLEANFSCASVWSGEMPTISAFSFANFFDKSRNSQDSLVHPGVSALGKKKITTRLAAELGELKRAGADLGRAIAGLETHMP